MKKLQSCVFAIALLVTMASLAAAQNYGELQGYVKGPDGAAIAGAEITVKGPNLLGTEKAMSDDKGYFRIINIPPGRYTVEVSKVGFKNVSYSDVYIRVGGTRTITPALEAATTAEQTITITTEAPIIDVASTGRNINIDGDFIKRLPLTYDREWDSVWSLVPGVVNEGQYGTFGNRVDVHGAGIFNNIWNLDGMNIGGSFTNANNMYFSQDIIEEVHIVTTGFDASVSSGQGGYVNVVTKSGGNEFHGAASFTFQPEEWNWSNVEGGKAAKANLYLPEFSLGGPIVVDKTWFFSSYRYNFRDEAYAYTASDIARFARVELAVPDQPRETRGHLFFGKVTHALTDSMRLIGTFNYDKSHERNADMYANGSVNSGIDIESGGSYGNVSLENTWADNLTSTLKVSYYTADNLIFGMGGFNEPSITRYSNASISASTGNLVGSGDAVYYNNRSGSGWGSDTTNSRWEVRGDARYYVEDFYGSHDFGFGFSAIPKQSYVNDGVYSDPYRIQETRNAAGQWIKFYQQDYDVQSIRTWDFGQEKYAAYLQDTWVVTDRLTLSAGVRMENLSDNVAIDITEFSPHVGVNYAITSDMTDSVRASYGLRHQMLEGRSGISGEGGGSIGHTQYWDNNLDGVWDVTLYTPGTPPVKTSTSSLSYAIDPDLGLPYTHEFQVGYARLLPYDMKADIAFVYKMYKGAWITFNDNLIYQGNTFVGYKNPAVNSVNIRMNDEWSTNHYNSLELTLSKEFSRGWQMMASYTWQRNVLKGEWRPDQPERYMYPADWFESVNDNIRPHIFRVATSAILPWDITFSGNILWQSGLADYFYRMPAGTNVGVPQTFVLSNGRVITHPFWSVSALYQARNEDRDVTMDNLMIVNAGIGKDFEIMGYKFQGQIQAFNLFNDDSFASRSANNTVVRADGTRVYSPVFSLLQPPRAVQALIKWVF